jgi:pimeloyl-ACP methyl ester carboxylesterase
MTETLRIETSDGLSLAVDVSGEGTAVMLVHGLGFNRERWSAQVEAFTAAGFQVIALDLRGCGESDMPTDPYDIPTLSADVERVREHLALETFHLIGHSLGGMVALDYTLAYPERVRTLTLASTTCHNGRRASALGSTISKLSDLGFEAAMADPVVAAEIDALCASVAIYVPAILEPLKRITAEPNRSRSLQWKATVGWSVRWKIAEITCPTLVMHGLADMLMPLRAGEKLHEGIAGSRWVAIAGAGHNIPVKHAEQFNASVLDFLAQSA